MIAHKNGTLVFNGVNRNANVKSHSLHLSNTITETYY